MFEGSATLLVIAGGSLGLGGPNVLVLDRSGALIRSTTSDSRPLTGDSPTAIGEVSSSPLSALTMRAARTLSEMGAFLRGVMGDEAGLVSTSSARGGGLRESRRADLSLQ